MKKTMMILLGAALLGLAACAHSESETSKAEAKSQGSTAAAESRSDAQQALDEADQALQAAHAEFLRSGNSEETKHLMSVAESKIEKANAIAPNEECRERAAALQARADGMSQDQSQAHAEAAPPPEPAAQPAEQPAAKPAKVPSPEGAVVVSDFEISDATLSGKMKEQLDVIVAKVGNSEATLVIEGHTDSTGTEQYNEKLSFTRAAAGRDYLVSKGIDAKRIEIKGAGANKPAASNDTEEDRAKNRRIEVVISSPAPVS